MYTISYFLMQFIVAFIATFGFAVLFNSPRTEVVYSGLTGALGWTAYKLIITLTVDNGVVATLAAAMIITAASRLLAYKRRMPLTVYLIGGIIPLVPGFGIYYTMYYLVTSDFSSAVTRGVDTLKISGVIVIGIFIILSLPWKLFYPYGSIKEITTKTRKKRGSTSQTQDL